MDTSCPADCFSWDWNSTFSDRALHIKGRGSKAKALLQWLKADPHLDNSGNLIKRAGLLEICVGVGIVVKDAQLIQFMEGDHDETTPDHIISSHWGLEEYDVFQNYTERLYKDLLHSIASSRYVGFVVIHRSTILI